jgi:hypothetical protein
MLEKIKSLRLPEGANSGNKNARQPNPSPKVVIVLIGAETSMVESVGQTQIETWIIGWLHGISQLFIIKDSSSSKRFGRKRKNKPHP